MAPALTGIATGDSVTQLQQKLGATQSQLNSEKAREQGLSGQIDALNSQVSALAGQIQLVQSREAGARARLAAASARLGAVRVATAREQRRLTLLHRILAHARTVLARQLRSQYEQPQQSFVSLLVDANGFQQLLDRMQYLSMAKHHEQSVITATREARGLARAAAARLLTLRHSDATAAGAAQAQTNALAGMGALLSSRESALADSRSARSAALSASQARGAQLQAAVASIQQQEQAAQQAEQAVRYSSSTAGSSGGGGGGAGLGSAAGWAIPYAIVLCESGGQNLPPNSAGASGYYQILPSTWSEYGGSGAAAYLASKSEQDAVAARIWNNGAGASNWACAAITGVS
ncbi:MAG: transglycosylase family protein [Acidobacteriota bacterium]|nr:transglycosylase family protein [Acidobacteriota bacterium]